MPDCESSTVFGSPFSCAFFADLTSIQWRPCCDPTTTLELQASVMDFEANKLLAERVREALRASLSNNRCLTAQQCATELGISVRGMQRRLKTIGLSFTTIANEIRYDLARTRLLHSRDTIEEIGRSLGFSTQESFIRAFTRWSDMSPGEFRRQSGS